MSVTRPHYTQNLSTFDYLPLEDHQIRLIQLLPGPRGSPIVCKIVHSDYFKPRAKAVPWECLSYMWGPTANPASILMNYKNIPVRRNLHSALQAVRDEVKIRIIWIDALCIDQNDMHERNKQVAMMGQIYRCATEVLVWLGEAADDSDMVLEHVVQSGEHQKQWAYIGYEWNGPVSQESAEALLAFYSRPYWRRIWIIQEVLGASSLQVFCGTKTLPGKGFHFAFHNFLEKLRELREESDPPQWATKDLVRAFNDCPGNFIMLHQNSGDTEGYSLIRMLEMCAHCKSESGLVHDRIYGYVGILKASQRDLIVPDYSKPLCQVYVDVHLSFMVPDTDSRYISMGSYTGKDLLKSCRTVQQILEDPLWDSEAEAFRPLSSICNSSQLQRMKDLRLQVWIEGVGVISEVGHILSRQEAATSDSPPLSQADYTTKEKFRAAAKELQACDFHCMPYIGTRYEQRESDSTQYDPINDPHSTERLISAVSDGKYKLFSTHNGLYGIASNSIQKGDLLYGFNALEWLFLPTNMFLVLRPGSGAEPKSFTLVGRAFVLPVPTEKYCSYRNWDTGKFYEFDFKGDLIAEGIDLDHGVWKGFGCYMDAVTLFLLTR